MMDTLTARTAGQALPAAVEGSDRLDVEPLLRMVAERDLSLPRQGDDGERLRKAYYRAVEAGAVTVRQADELAVGLLRCHPYEVWGDAWFDVPIAPPPRRRRGQSAPAPSSVRRWRPAPARPASARTAGSQLSWVDAAAKVLRSASGALTVAELVDAIEEAGLRDTSDARTPKQTLARDLRRAAARGDKRFVREGTRWTVAQVTY